MGFLNLIGLSIVALITIILASYCQVLDTLLC